MTIALLFGLEHKAGAATWTNAMLGATAGSLLFGMAALATRGLAMPIGLHAAWNFGQWMLGAKETPGLWKTLTDGRLREIPERVGIISYLVVMAAATLSFWLYKRRVESNRW